MPMPTLTTLLTDLVFPESPRWREGRLVFSDMLGQEIVALDEHGGRETLTAWDDQVSGLGWLPDGRLLFVSMKQRRVMRREADGAIVPHADLSGIATGDCNDMVVDAEGRAYVGNFGFVLHPQSEVKPACVALVQPDGTASEAAGGLMFPNGMVITPDGRSLIVGESWGGRLTAFAIGEHGTLSERRVWVQLPERAAPDGCCLDAEGCVWVASPTTREVLRMREGGTVVERVAIDGVALACMLGGADRRTLYVMVTDSMKPDKCLARRNGRIQAMRVEVAGAGLP